MTNYQKVTVKLTSTQLSKLKSAAKNKLGIILGINEKNFQNEGLPHKLQNKLLKYETPFLTICQQI